MTATENTAPAPTVSGGEGWEEAAKIKLLDWFGKDFGFDFDDAWESAEQALALIAVARGGFSALQASPSVPTEEHSLPVLASDADAMRAGRAILDAHGQWEIENNRRGGQNPWQREHLILLGRAALSARPDRQAGEPLPAEPFASASGVRAGDDPQALPAVQAETAVVGALRDALKDLLWEWDCLGHGDEGGDPVPDQHPAAVKARAALSQAAVSTGEQPGMSEPFAWASRWEGHRGVSVELHSDKNEAADNAKWMHGEAFPLYDHAAPTLPADLLSLSEAATQGEWVSLPDSNQLYTAEGELVAHFSVIEEASLAAASVNFIRTLAARQNRAGETT